MLTIRVQFFYLLYCCCNQFVTSQGPVVVQSPLSQSVCAGETINFTCVVMFTNQTPAAAIWLTNNGIADATKQLGHTTIDDSNGRSSPANVTTVLIVTNVNISANYLCVQGISDRSDIVSLTVFDPLSTQLMLVEDDCQVDSFDVSWRSSPDQSVCELTYKVTLSIITLNGSNNIMVTNFTNNTYFNFTGLISNTFYSVEVVLLHNNDSKFERINVTTKAEPLTTTSSISEPTSSVSSSPIAPMMTSPSNDERDNAPSGSRSSNTTTVIIIVVVIVLIIIVILIICMVLVWRHYRTKKDSIKPNEATESNYAETKRQPLNEEVKQNEEYAYAVNGPRGIKFSSEKPQQQ